MPRFLKPLILLCSAAAAAATFRVGTAQASQCSDALIHDWYVDGRIDNTYQVHCYRDALKDIPEDQLVYGTLRDDLTRALENVIRDHNGHVTRSTLVPGAGNGPCDGPGRGPAGVSHDKGLLHWHSIKWDHATAYSAPLTLLALWAT